MKTRLVLVFALVVAASTASGAKETEASRALAAADWSRMETVTVTLTEHAFTPSAVALREGVPTKLVLRNQGTEPHYFVAEEFFGTIASRKVQSSDGEVKAPRFTAVEVYPGKTIEWFLVPLRKGNYGLLCTVKGHAERGMTGTIVVR
ncbi:MAG TPA: hypothetical protein DD658_05150 [Deltaproteobacteria bacterium]|nr:MAG: hypothetical protein A2X88_06265 [Deltaproteobacteria bacterium GWC2_65_14]HBO69549.1 hypothetical protein [Deltaproteobacteria bacterium]